jgi:hypothetical protein
MMDFVRPEAHFAASTDHVAPLGGRKPFPAEANLWSFFGPRDSFLAARNEIAIVQLSGGRAGSS